jgi:hypothetical protein
MSMMLMNIAATKTTLTATFWLTRARTALTLPPCPSVAAARG